MEVSSDFLQLSANSRQKLNGSIVGGWCDHLTQVFSLHARLAGFLHGS